ncbi:DUF1206 domain-containing protein [Roseisolibacter sp. H3M3-2]|uniref:DUF1206 domain-containing protein n=1 Tax=Roseisolibacter sp. H3M3-2 TaxID=3031323 RepID=UPI0023DCE5DF|nr:DUF1206 domain-containing protein [Roseisolibacter sp. H3M3-2]MDF1504797.1 DUF1206 domain-containing protein [Roseisolibacter sp. H3M3-2]
MGQQIRPAVEAGMHRAGRLASEGAPWLTRAARLGYAARGVVYVTLALLALQAAMGRRQAEGQGGALRTIAEQPAGQLLLVIVTIGLFGYAAWRLLESARGADGEGSDAKGIALRLAHAGSGLLYGSLGLQAIRLLQGGAQSNDEARAEGWTSRLMALPWGRALVAAVALGVLVYAGQQLWKAARGDVTKHLDLHALGASGRRNVERLGRAGTAARAVVFVVSGGFLLLAARDANPSEATGLSGALTTLQGAPWGPWLLGLVALGLLAFGLFQIVQARYRVVRPVA